jgi:hypothetical protein
MKHDKFITEATESLQKQLVVTNNQIVGASKTNFLSIGLFLKLPIRVEALQYEKCVPTKKLTLQDLSNNLVVRTDLTSKPEVVFTFLYNDEKHLKHLLKVINKQSILASYYYIKEIQHLIRKHYTPEYQTMMIRAIPTQSDPHYLLKLACDQSVNHFMGEMFKQSVFTKEWEEISKLVPMPSGDLTLDIDILKSIASSVPQATAHFNDSRFVTYELNGFTYHTPAFMATADAPEAQTIVANMATALLDVVRSNAKGTSGADAMLQSFDAILIDTAWLDNFKSDFNSVVHSKTTKFAKTWKRLSNTYRHLFNAPSNEYYDNKINVIFSIDQSGSMEIEDMAKVYGVVQQNKHRINEITILIHDVDLVYTNRTKDVASISEASLRKMFGTRYSQGGTSHAKTLQFIADMKISNPEQYIYICMSDMYSDIETEWPKHKQILKRIATFWLAPSNCRTIDTTTLGGKNIQLP